MELFRTLLAIYNNPAIMRVASHYFLTMFGIYCVQDNYFKTLKDTVGNDAAKAFCLNFTAAISFPISLIIAIIVKMFNDHRIVLVVQYLLFIISLVIECFIYKRNNIFLAYLSATFYNIGQGTVFTTLDFLKINSLTLTGSLHSVTIVGIGSSFGQMCGLFLPIIFCYFEKDDKECRQKLRFVAIFITSLCVIMALFFSPKCDYNLKAIKSKEELNEKKRSKKRVFMDLLKLIISPSYFIFITGLLLHSGVQKNIKLLQKDFVTKMGASEMKANVGQFVSRGFSILCYSSVIYITSEKMIFNYFSISCFFGVVRGVIFYYISKREKFTFIYQSLIILIYTVEDGFQNLAVSRICNFLSPNHLKVYSQGFFTSIKNSLSIVLSSFINKYINNNSTEITAKIYSSIWLTMTGMAFASTVLSIILLLLNRKK